MSCKGVTFSFSVSGASLASALAILSVKLSLRRLPTIVTMLCGAAMGGDPLLERNRLPCLAAPAKRCKCMKLDFEQALRRVIDHVPAAAAAHMGADRSEALAPLTLAPGAQSNASALTICQPGFKNATNFWFRTLDGNGVSRCTTRITSSMPSRFPSLS